MWNKNCDFNNQSLNTMGIKSLSQIYKLVGELGIDLKVKPQDVNILHGDNVIAYVDAYSLIYPMGMKCTSIFDVIRCITFMFHKTRRVILFVDNGVIMKKEKERERRQSSRRKVIINPSQSGTSITLEDGNANEFLMPSFPIKFCTNTMEIVPVFKMDLFVEHRGEFERVDSIDQFQPSYTMGIGGDIEENNDIKTKIHLNYLSTFSNAKDAVLYQIIDNIQSRKYDDGDIDGAHDFVSKYTQAYNKGDSISHIPDNPIVQMFLIRFYGRITLGVIFNIYPNFLNEIVLTFLQHLKPDWKFVKSRQIDAEYSLMRFIKHGFDNGITSPDDQIICVSKDTDITIGLFNLPKQIQMHFQVPIINSLDFDDDINRIIPIVSIIFLKSDYFPGIAKIGPVTISNFIIHLNKSHPEIYTKKRNEIIPTLLELFNKYTNWTHKPILSKDSLVKTMSYIRQLHWYVTYDSRFWKADTIDDPLIPQNLQELFLGLEIKNAKLIDLLND